MNGENRFGISINSTEYMGYL